MNIKDITQEHKDKLWNDNSEYFKYVFGRMLVMYKTGIDYDSGQSNNVNVDKYCTINDKGTSVLIQFTRLLIGYNGIGFNITPTRCGLISERASVTSNSECTNDHLIGVTEVGNQVVKEFIKCNYDVDYMVNEWLYEHLHYWFTVKITKVEHKQENLARNKHSLEDKINLVHYDEAGINLK